MKLTKITKRTFLKSVGIFTAAAALFPFLKKQMASELPVRAKQDRRSVARPTHLS